MVVLGLLLILACAAVAVDAVVQNSGTIHAIAFNHSVGAVSIGALFVAGCVVGLVFALGMAMFGSGLGRAARIRRERRALRRDNAATDSLREENARLEQQLAAERSAAPAYPEGPAAASRTDTATAGRHRIGR
jgi:uncharacterized protein HemX